MYVASLGLLVYSNLASGRVTTPTSLLKLNLSVSALLWALHYSCAIPRSILFSGRPFNMLVIPSAQLYV